MKEKQNSETPSLVLLATRVPPETQEEFKKLAESHRRSVTAQLRVLVEETLKEAA